MRRRFGGSRVLLYACLAVALRIAGVAYMSRDPGRFVLVPPDTRDSYLPLAQSLTQGGTYALRGDAREASRIPPVFPIFLAGTQLAFGAEPPIWLLGVLNALIRGGTTFLTYLLGRALLSSAAGASAALLHALDPWEVFWTPFVLKEPLGVCTFVLAVWLVVEVAREPTRSRGVVAGCAIGLASLTRFASLALLACALILLAERMWKEPGHRRAALLAAGALSLGALAALSPWLLRNRLLFGEWALSSHPLGRYLYVATAATSESEASGNAPVGVRDPGPIKEAERPGIAPSTAGRRLLLAALGSAVADPSRVLGRWAGRLVGMWRPTWKGSSWLNVVLLGGPYLLQMTLAALGLRLALGARVGLRPLVWILATFVALHIVLFADIRFRQYLTPLFCVPAGYWLAQRAARVPGRSRATRQASPGA